MNTLWNINNTLESYQQLIDLYNQHKEDRFEDIHLELRNWFAANMSAALGAILDRFQQNMNSINFDYIKPDTEAILLKNDFLAYFGYPHRLDSYHTTIRFLKLKPTDGKYFNNYVVEELLGRTELPEMSDLVKDKVAEAIYEIFVNAQIHSETDSIYTCGQFFPAKSKIEFTIVDTGIGFKEKVNRRFGTNLTATQAIKWATQDKNTTKVGVSGGIGLALLKEFVRKNKGKMQIVSNDGFYEYSRVGEQTSLFNGCFPGTIVNLQFRTDDSSSYVMRTELSADDIF
ncbi:ATP-binding protein [Mangrovibacterium marinum]|uniref:Histidine kinase/DNA gyrase B/HSP90-like ATPase n=1 Tax=Mangrovibacterium marinum TaxID=1639118 RepID=A0A2T5C1Y6_9BACT|nr:ATP-binding protein [Mangrovibacterium marinum]PTN08657.1 histidine kinase/DNA gyrase B/HSP90-like ATPase [Mangrovibacterium marinum]